MSKGFVAVSQPSCLQPGLRPCLVVDDHSQQIASVTGRLDAIDDLCVHEESRVSPGCRKSEPVFCTLHGSRFSTVTCKPLEEPANRPLLRHLVREVDTLLVRVRPS